MVGEIKRKEINKKAQQSLDNLRQPNQPLRATAAVKEIDGLAEEGNDYLGALMNGPG